MTPAPHLIVAELPEGFTLDYGAHGAYFDGGACLLEACSYLAGEPFSDRPESVCPVLAAFGRSWNDALDNDERQILLPYARRLVGTKTTHEIEERRAWMATDWMVRECTPAWLRLAGLTDHAHALEHLAAVTSAGTAREAQPKIAAAGDAAMAAARAAARAAMDAARAAAVDAARAVAEDAARAAAMDAAWSAIESTKRGLQESALRLLDSMIAVTP